jgi:hypothetical protein
MTWAQRLKLVFNIDIETCFEFGGEVRMIASTKDPAVIQKIPAYLDHDATSVTTVLLPECRASPTGSLFVWRSKHKRSPDPLLDPVAVRHLWPVIGIDGKQSGAPPPRG